MRVDVVVVIEQVVDVVVVRVVVIAAVLFCLKMFLTFRLGKDICEDTLPYEELEKKCLKELNENTV